jgi:hypothetical protein
MLSVVEIFNRRTKTRNADLPADSPGKIAEKYKQQCKKHPTPARKIKHYD